MTPTKDEALDLALEALEPFSTPNWAGTGVDKANAAVTAIRQVRSAPVQESVAHCEAGPAYCQQCHLEDRSLALDAAVRYVKNNTPKLVSDEICMALSTPPAAQPAVQDVKELFGYEIWSRFYRSKPELLDEMVRPNAGYPLDWIEANIREVYVHGTYALAEKGGAA